LLTPSRTSILEKLIVTQLLKIINKRDYDILQGTLIYEKRKGSVKIPANIKTGLRFKFCSFAKMCWEYEHWSTHISWCI